MGEELAMLALHADINPNDSGEGRENESPSYSNHRCVKNSFFFYFGKQCVKNSLILLPPVVYDVF